MSWMTGEKWLKPGVKNVPALDEMSAGQEISTSLYRYKYDSACRTEKYIAPQYDQIDELTSVAAVRGSTLNASSVAAALIFCTEVHPSQKRA